MILLPIPQVDDPGKHSVHILAGQSGPEPRFPHSNCDCDLPCLALLTPSLLLLAVTSQVRFCLWGGSIKTGGLANKVHCSNRLHT